MSIQSTRRKDTAPTQALGKPSETTAPAAQVPLPPPPARPASDSFAEAGNRAFSSGSSSAANAVSAPPNSQAGLLREKAVVAELAGVQIPARTGGSPTAASTMQSGIRDGAFGADPTASTPVSANAPTSEARQSQLSPEKQVDVAILGVRDALRSKDPTRLDDAIKNLGSLKGPELAKSLATLDKLKLMPELLQRMSPEKRAELIKTVADSGNTKAIDTVRGALNQEHVRISKEFPTDVTSDSAEQKDPKWEAQRERFVKESSELTEGRNKADLKQLQRMNGPELGKALAEMAKNGRLDVMLDTLSPGQRAALVRTVADSGDHKAIDTLKNAIIDEHKRIWRELPTEITSGKSDKKDPRWEAQLERFVQEDRQLVQADKAADVKQLKLMDRPELGKALGEMAKNGKLEIMLKTLAPERRAELIQTVVDSGDRKAIDTLRQAIIAEHAEIANEVPYEIRSGSSGRKDPAWDAHLESYFKEDRALSEAYDRTK